ncbi:hypothetical protein CC1G_15154 [Coprinopsis cinerea okayama7|uniref:Uncharacterized protein n=1 Tax=Coprinopsis cinerea (strain Okayama-7 / 130 / ATCC MYA-4618 / FGSC 9003) TaxID=240176 RepID=D6RPS1_COPC7|nr:hypothetical protein CC1G_15154 [Coprinopsis cinerea okayama7\|eukprot:XP_002910515.1 hypothetical protein CC1G_15154 [Coprinopsis cinerea okayama7\
MTSTLRPPTTVSESSLVRRNVKYHPRQQLILDASLRKQIRVTVDPPSLDAILEHDEEGFSADETPDSPSKARSRELKAIGDHLGRVKAVGRALKELCPALGVLFDQMFGEAAYAQRKKAPSAYKDFFIQVAAEESVLQMINNSSVLALRSFLQNPTKATATQILAIPALYKVVQVHHDVASLVPIMVWLETRASHMLSALKVEEPLPGVQDGAAVGETRSNWTLTGCLYSMPQIRYRPKYPRLRNDQQRDKSSKRGDACGKYFTQYGEQRLTGGLMVAWCTHGICYGFHCIAESEGRDDVFSAMVTRWPVAPKRVVSGHTKCSPAAFLSEYANIDPRLVIINSSAAECGNGGLKKIRKSVSYMSQTRAIIYSKVFLSVWNRVRERRAKPK